ncbi:MAG: hypothetical protein HYS27_03330 [Deltaproteobacteria bacterium]|nr:hypothetical protein [Deltaproteobacteria bacterium]
MPDGDSSQPKLKISQWPLSIWRAAAAPLGFPADATSSDDKLRQWISQPGFEAQPRVNELLEVEEEFGTDVGIEPLDEALRERAVDVRAWGDLPTPDVVARAFVEMHAEAARGGEQRVRDAFVSARFRTATVHRRVSFEFFGAPGVQMPSDLAPLKASLRLTFFGEGFGDDVEAEYLDGALFVGRGGKLRAPVVVDNGYRKALVHRPAVTDVLRYDAASGVLRITARNRRLARVYADALGEVYFKTKKHFRDGIGLTLEPLKRGNAALISTGTSPFDDVVLTKFAGSEGTLTVGGGPLDLERLVEAYPEVELTEARLRMHLREGGRITAIVRPDKGVVVDKKEHEASVEAYLAQIGVRGVSAEVPDLWSTFPWGQRESVWREVFGNELDALAAAGVFENVKLQTVEHPDHVETLVVHDVDASSGDFYGAGREAEDGARVLTASDVGGLRLSPRRLAEHVAGGLRCEVNVTDVDDGRVWRLGRCAVVEDHEVELVLVVGRPRGPLIELLRPVLGEAPFIALVPPGGGVADGRTVMVKHWTDWRQTRARLAEMLGVRALLPLQEQRPGGLVLKRSSGQLAVHDNVFELVADSPAAKLVEALVGAYPDPVATSELDGAVGAWAVDGEALKRAKYTLKNILKKKGVTIESVMVKRGNGWLGLAVPGVVV